MLLVVMVLALAFYFFSQIISQNRYDLEKQMDNAFKKHANLNDERDKLVASINSNVASLKGRVNEIETLLFHMNEATDSADKLTEDLNDILSKLEESFPEPKEAITSQSIDEIAEEELEDWTDPQNTNKEVGDLDGAELYSPAEDRERY
jgi:uncharacterized protein YoxC